MFRSSPFENTPRFWHTSGANCSAIKRLITDSNLLFEWSLPAVIDSVTRRAARNYWIVPVPLCLSIQRTNCTTVNLAVGSGRMRERERERDEVTDCYLLRSGLGSLRRGMGKTSTPELAGGQRKTKAAMIWKKGWKGWKKLHSFGSNSNKTGESYFSESFRLRSPLLLTNLLLAIVNEELRPP